MTKAIAAIDSERRNAMKDPFIHRYGVAVWGDSTARFHSASRLTTCRARQTAQRGRARRFPGLLLPGARILAFLAFALYESALTSTPSSAAGGWRIAAQKSVSGEFAVTAISATVHHPRSLAVRLHGNVDTGEAVVACPRGFSVSSNARSYSHAGTFRLPMARNADSCDITASVGGSGLVRVQILRK